MFPVPYVIPNVVPIIAIEITPIPVGPVRPSPVLPVVPLGPGEPVIPEVGPAGPTGPIPVLILIEELPKLYGIMYLFSTTIYFWNFLNLNHHILLF